METLEPTIELGERPPSANRGVWLALSLSLAAHALIVIAMLCSAAGHSEGSGGANGHESSIYLEPVRLSLAEPDSSASNDDSHSQAPAGRPQMDVPVVSISPRPEAVVAPLSPSANTDTSPAKSARETSARSSGTPAPHPASPGTGLGSAAGSATTALFGISTRGKRVVYLIDRSISMGLNNALPLAKRELLESLRRLAPDTSFQVLVYNRFAEPLVTNGLYGLLTPSEDILERIAALLEPLRAEGGTNHLVALQRALQSQPDVIYLVTDGDDLSADQIRTVMQLNRGRTVINAIEIGYASPNRLQGPLALLAHQNGGVFRVVNLPGQSSN